jgi:mannose-6-phosphate isomerase-like protein (cupin superfamily)
MATTHIDTNRIARKRLNGHGEVAEILNKELCGAENVKGMLRWLAAGEALDAEALEATHQLIYLMEGEGTITLEGKQYDVAKGAGIYLGPTESASIAHRGSAPLKLFHLVVPIKQELQLDS